MLSLFDEKNNLIHRWHIKTPNLAIDFIAHCTDILTHHSDGENITIFYGFLDQDCTKSNPAAFVSKLLKNNDINALNQCYGSFITVHYSIKKHEVIVANDALGDFAAHYYQSDKKLTISDFPEPLLNKHNASVNESRVLHYFAHTKPQNNGSFFTEIKQLNPGSGLILNVNKTTLQKYYHPSEKVDFKSSRKDELVNEFKSRMQAAITYQTQGQKRVAVMMSGGMDSTFVAGNALKVNKNVSSFSYVFPNYTMADESRWLDALRHLDLDMHTFSGESHWPLKPPVHISINAPILNPYRPLKDVIYHSCENKNIKYLLTGSFADHLYAGYIYWLVDQIKTKPFKGLRSLLNVSKSQGFMQGLKQISPLKWSNKTRLRAPWMNPQALKLHQKNFFHKLGNKHPHPQQWALTFGISTAQSNWLENEYAFKHNILLRHPFRDRRVVEFLMALPAYVLGKAQNPKAFVREAAKDVLPDAIIRRKTITTLEPLLILGLLGKEIAKVTDLLTHPESTWHNYIDKKIINKILNNPSEQHQEAHLLCFWQCVSYELWKLRIKEL